MSGKRNTLHINKLDEFRTWLVVKGIPFRDGKGYYEVMQVDVPGYGWRCIYSRHDMKQHYTVEQRYLLPLVRQFIRETAKTPQFTGHMTSSTVDADILREALEKIANWELPDTGEFWDGDTSRPITYEAKYGSSGVQQYIRTIAREALGKATKINLTDV